MFTSRVIRRCLIPAATVVTELKDSKNEELRCKRSELPIYTPEPAHDNTTFDKKEEIPGYIEDAFRNIRLTITKYNDEIQAYKKVGVQHFEKSKEDLEYIVNYLQEEDNTLPKAGAIGIGALTGLIFGLRGGFFKRVLYASTGALGMAALCYPKEATEYSEIGITEAKKYVTIAYNFAYGVKKDDPPLELPSLPKIPSNLSEAWENIKSTATSFVSDEKKLDAMGQEQVTGSQDNVAVKDPLGVITKSRDNAISKSCHCPIGACLGHPDKTPSNPTGDAKNPAAVS